MDEPTPTSVFVCAPDPDPACFDTPSTDPSTTTTTVAVAPSNHYAELPRTGASTTSALAMLALMLILCGCALLAAVKRATRA